MRELQGERLPHGNFAGHLGESNLHGLRGRERPSEQDALTRVMQGFG
jgi:hypothetical protein